MDRLRRMRKAGWLHMSSIRIQARSRSGDLFVSFPCALSLSGRNGQVLGDCVRANAICFRGAGESEFALVRASDIAR